MSEALFQKVLKFTANFEGIKFTDDPTDVGGPTKMGITQLIYNVYRQNKGLPSQSVSKMVKTECVDVYRTMFWMTSYAYLFEYPLALALFDTYVQFNPPTEENFVDKALGLINPTTSEVLTKLKSLAPLDQITTARAIANGRYQFRADLVAKHPSQKKYLKGWQRRDKALLSEINNYVLIEKVKKQAIVFWSYCRKCVGLS